MNVKIYKPSKTSMQAGKAKTHAWVLEYDNKALRKPEPLMGWTQSESTLHQVKLKFESAEDATAYAEKQGWSYTILPPRERRVKPRNYGDNFKYFAEDEA